MPPRKQAPPPVAPPKHETSIPLHCLLCPKNPTFSDVSHLLTHISSKSHLSTRFNIEIRSGKERDARETLRQFDFWYDRYNIQELLADRMDAKDKKKGSNKRGRDQSPEPKPRTYTKREKLIKPELEPALRRSTRGSLHAHSSRQDYGDDDSPYRTPVTRRSQPLLSGNAASRRKVKHEPSDDIEPFEDHFQEPDPVEEPTEVAAVDVSSDKSKLKGVLWPGMALFDSATEEQRRKRNQRKDAGVLRNMEQVAASVEPTEWIWSGDITDLHRQRDIYATPSVVGSPEPEAGGGAEPAKKKRARRSTAAPKTAPVRKKRASTRAIRSKKDIKQEEEDDDSALMSEVIDASHETTPVDDTGSESKRPSSSSTNSPDGEDEVYDIFRDPPGAGSGPTDGANNCMQFDPSARQALQPLNPNMSMNSPAANSFKHLPSLRRGVSEMSPNEFYSSPYGMPTNNFNNPLSFAQGRVQNPYANQFTGNGTYAEDPKTLGAFHPLNNNILHSMHMNHNPPNPSSNSYYTQPVAQDEAQRDWKI